MRYASALLRYKASVLFSSFGIKTTLSQIPLVSSLLFQKYKMNEIISNFSLAGNTFMPEIHLRHPAEPAKPQFTYSASGPFTKKFTKLRTRNYFVIVRSLICNRPLLKDISFSTKCLLVWWLRSRDFGDKSSSRF